MDDTTGSHLELRRYDLAIPSLQAGIEHVCFEGAQLQLVGNTGWHSKGGEKPCADEQAIDAAAFAGAPVPAGLSAERGGPRTGAGVVGDELHAAAALLIAAWIFT